MTVYESLITKDKQPSCPSPNPCCEEPCDEPSFWVLLPQCRLNWIAFGLAAIAIGFALIGLGYINIGTSILGATGSTPIPNAFNSTTLAQGTSLITILLSLIVGSAWFFFKTCSDDWKSVIVGSLLGAAGFPLAAIGAVYLTVSQIDNLPSPAPPFDPTWFNIARNILIISVIAFLVLAYLIRANTCYGCIDAKRGITVSLIFIGAGWATWSLGRLLATVIVTFQYANFPPTQPPLPPPFTFPSAAYNAAVFVSIINIALILLLGWYILGCVAENCFTLFLPLFASAAPLGNWALYRVGLNVFSFVGTGTTLPPSTASLIQFVYAIGFLSIIALLLTFVIAIRGPNAAVVTVSSTITLFYAIATYTYVEPPPNGTGAGSVALMLQGIFQGIAITVVLNFFLWSKAKCPIPSILYGLASGSFGWAVIYLYSTSTTIITTNQFSFIDPTIINIGLNVVIAAAILGFLYVQFVVCDELLGAITLLNIALLTVGAAGFIGIIAFYLSFITDPSDIRAAIIIYVVFVFAALFLPQYFVRCVDCKRQLIITVASLASGVAAIEFGQAVALGRAVAFNGAPSSIFFYSFLLNIASVFITVFVGQAIIWTHSQANICTALIAVAIGLLANGIAAQARAVGNLPVSTPFFSLATIGEPWLVFTLLLVALLIYLQFKSFCIQQHCRFLIGLLIPVFGIAIFGKTAGANALLAFVKSRAGGSFNYPFIYYINSRVILVNAIIPLAGFFLSLQIFKCTSCLAYLPSSIAYIAVAYVTSQSETPYFLPVLSTQTRIQVGVQSIAGIFPPLLNWITSVYTIFAFEDSGLPRSILLASAMFVAQVGLTYILFLSPALIAGFVFSCSKPVSAAIIGAAIAATVISFGAFGISNVISGILYAITDGFMIPIATTPITGYITFANFINGISSQLVLLAVGVLTVLFIYFNNCRYNSC